MSSTFHADQMYFSYVCIFVIFRAIEQEIQRDIAISQIIEGRIMFKMVFKNRIMPQHNTKVVNNSSSQSLVLLLMIAALFIVADFVGILLSLYGALCFRYGMPTDIPPIILSLMPVYLTFAAAATIGIQFLAKTYVISMLKYNLLDAIKTGFCLCVAYMVCLIANHYADFPLPLPVVLNFFCLNTLFVGFFRLSVRSGHWIYGSLSNNLKIQKNILIMGAGGAGQYLVNMLMYGEKDEGRIVGYIDDDPSLWGKRIKGIKVLGGREDIIEVAKKYKVQEIIIAIPHVDNSTIREIYQCCEKSECIIKRFSNLSDFTSAGLSKATIKEVQVEDLLGRNEVELDMSAARGMLCQKTVIVTGGAGSIGSEICRQVLYHQAKLVIIFDFNENGLFDIGNELAASYSRDKFVTVLGSVRDEKRLQEVFEHYHPQIVYHAAAHKHVPMMEINPYEALANNALGTYKTAMTAKKFGVESFTLISTDKAVNPTNVMGASKRIAEQIIQYMNHDSKTVFSAVRFGNVLGSNGSVVPLFKKQIARGGPLTVTDKNIKRYFMTIQEAVQLVLEASTMARGSEIFVLNMGEPVYIYDLACTMIRLSGLKPDKDIRIEITGLRDGEKLFEEINLDSENVRMTENKKIFVLRSTQLEHGFISQELQYFFEAIRNRDHSHMYERIKVFVPSFKMNTNLRA